MLDDRTRRQTVEMQRHTPKYSNKYLRVTSYRSKSPCYTLRVQLNMVYYLCKCTVSNCFFFGDMLPPLSNELLYLKENFTNNCIQYE